MPSRGRPTVVLYLLSRQLRNLSRHSRVGHGYRNPFFFRLGVGGIPSAVTPTVPRDFGNRCAGHAPAVEPPQPVPLARIQASGDLWGNCSRNLFEGVRAVDVVEDAVTKERPVPELCPARSRHAFLV